ncbi:MAP3K epsilon protein kinase 1-like [Zingiber officinale]|uniref:MAP3K epsilon protein kinase 1-like n=1 Tax=Zingiber officinale TaxID=94328 RepID=UPI001C4DC4AF|nr:MAP3K epsilon protein kinase 1-like [Zingiber officinale]
MSRQATPAHFHKSKTLDNKYMIGDKIGKGAYGTVYRGLDLENVDFVAIKQVSLENILQEDLNFIMQEIDLLKNLNHKNIVKYLGSIKTKTHLHIVLEYVENGSLANIIKPNKFGPFPEPLVAFYIAQVLEGLVYLHEQGVIHRDIKGANILTTKEGLVKLADFGVATKLTEADVNAHSVFGTPYWMAPEVIEMSGVSAASDIWSVGCTVIELLTCVPPYSDLQPMPALFRIVQDEHPPIPEGLSPDITDFLLQCFKKDAMQRPDAKTLLLHPWIQNSRRALQSSLRQNGGSLKYIEDDSTPENDNSNVDNGSESPSTEKRKSRTFDPEQDEYIKEHFATDLSHIKSDNEGQKPIPLQHTLSNGVETKQEDGPSAKDPTIAIHDKLSCKSSAGAVLSSPVALEAQGGLSFDESDRFSFGTRTERNIIQKVAQHSNDNGDGGVSRFSDTPKDACLEDLFQPLDRQRNQGAEDSSSSAGQQNDLAKELKARMAQKQLETEQSNGGKLLEIVMNLQDDMIDIDGSVFNENLPPDNLFPLQSIEFSKIVSLLKPEASEDVLLTSCQKLLEFFTQCPRQKHVYMSQHGFLPLMELLDNPKNRVICSVLQIINHIIRDNTGFQENACLVGLIPVVMNFAVTDWPREVRMQAAFFLQQLCQSSTWTLQMFIACQGIPVLVGFLEADYGKYREMVHLAIDGMWQVFKLQHSTPKNDFCRIAAKKGILIRLVNTLYSLNEATRLSSVAGGGLSIIQNRSALKPRSGPLDPLSRPSVMQGESPISHMGQIDTSKIRFDHRFSSRALEKTQNPACHSQWTDATQLDKQFFGGDNVYSNHAILEDSKDNAHHSLWDHEPSCGDADLPRHLGKNSASRTSTDKPQKHMEFASNGHSGGPIQLTSQNEQIRPLLSFLEKEPPSRHVSGQLDYVRHISGLERHESILPLLHASNEKRTNGELDFLMAEFAAMSRHEQENGSMDCNMKLSSKASKMALPAMGSTNSNDGASTSGLVSQNTTGILSGSGVLNARPGSTTSSGLLSQMVSSSNADVTREYLEKVADLLLVFAQAHTLVKSYLCSQSLLTRLFQMFNKMELPILLKILKCINHLSMDPNCLESLQRANVIKYLIPNLDLCEGSLVSQIHNEVLKALFNLCKINKRRQEQAAENGIIPHLMNFITSDSPLKQYALPLLCDMAHASRNSREQLRAHGGLDVYLNLLENEAWAGITLDSIAVCLAHDNEQRKVEQTLLKKESIHKLVKYFCNCPEQHFAQILEPFLKILTKSPRINTAMATNGLTTLLVARLEHQDAIARLNLLKLIKAVYEHHPRPKQLIVENDLPQKLQNLIEERRDGQTSGGQVLVKQMATALLKALHINTVL